MIKVRGRMPALVKIFFIKFKETVIVSLPEGGKVTIHTDGSVTRTSNFRETFESKKALKSLETN